MFEGSIKFHGGARQIKRNGWTIHSALHEALGSDSHVHIFGICKEFGIASLDQITEGNPCAIQVAIFVFLFSALEKAARAIRAEERK